MLLLKQYVISVCAAALICGFILSIAGSTVNKKIIRILCAVFLCLTMIEPLQAFEFDPDKLKGFVMDPQKEDALKEGSRISSDSISEIISEEISAYILDKAKSLGLSIQAEVILSGSELPVPEAVIIYGSVPPFEKHQLEAIIENDLGIPKEAQTWTG